VKWLSVVKYFAMRATYDRYLHLNTSQSQRPDQGLLFKDQDKDKDCIVKDKDQDKDCILVLKESLRTRTMIRTNITVLLTFSLGLGDVLVWGRFDW